MPAPLTFSQLVTPMASGVSPGVTASTVPSGTWLAVLLASANNLNLPVTAWQSGGVAWTQDLMLADMLASLDGGTASIEAQAGFLDFAATGTVTYVNAGGLTVTVPVTPDPSIPSQNPTGALGWLDTLANSVFNVQRIAATYASQTLYFVNTTGVSAGGYPVGGFHVANNFTGASYNNSAVFTGSPSSSVGTAVASVAYGSPPVLAMSAGHGLTVSSNVVVYVSGVPGLSSNWANAFVTDATHLSLTGVTGAGTYVSGGKVWIPQAIQFVADLIGPGSNASPGQVTTTITSVPGCFTWNLLAFTGSPWQSNTSVAATCRAQLQAVSPNGAQGAYYVYALQAPTILAAQAPAKTLTQNVTRVQVSQNKSNGSVVTTIANATGGVPGAVNVLVNGATNTSPIVIACASTGAMTTGMFALVAGVQGNAAANGYWQITVVDGTHFSLNGSAGNGAWTTGGVAGVGDLGLVDSVLQAYATPNGVTETTQSASNVTVTVAATIYVPAAFIADFGASPTSNKATVALAGFFPLIPIGGTQLPNAASGIVDISAISDLIFDSGTTAGQKYTVSVQGVTLNGTAASLALSSTQVSVLGAATITPIPV